MMDERLLPEGFEDLESIAHDWALATEQERTRRRYRSNYEELKRVYDAILPRLNAMFAYLNRFALDEMPADAARLFHLSLALAEIAPAVENFKGPQVIPGPEGALLAVKFTPLEDA